MHQLYIKSLEKCIEVAEEQSLLQAIQAQRIDWLHTCGGKGRCVSCRVSVVEGKENLSPRSEVEDNFLQQKRLQPDERLTCQTTVIGNAAVVVPKKVRLGHVVYKD
jgi:2Fe-2S ferredoxin